MNKKPIIGLCLREACLELFWSNFNWTVYFFAGCISISFSVIACIQRQSCSGRFIFLHLSTLLRSDLPGSHVAKKLVLFWVRALQSFFFTFFFMAYANLATSPKRLETELTNITERHFCSLPVFCIEHSFAYFLLSEFFPLFVCFDILWQLATTHERDNTRDRDANSSRQNDFTWCDFFAGETSRAPALSLAFAAEKTETLPIALLAREKFELTCIGKSTILQMLCCA